MGRSEFNVEGESVIVAGGSQGLGRELALLLAAQGADVTIIARSAGPLKETRQELFKHVKNESQTISSVALDLADAAKVEEYVASLESPPTVLFCVAGGAAADLGFFADISTRNIQACMEKNYFSAAFIAHAVFRRWTKEPVASPTRHIIFTSSTAAFLGFPGYSAYAPTKTATRALADTLRQEALLYSSQQEIKVHCTFPGTFYSEGFYEEQKNKPQLLKEMEGTTADEGGLTTKRIAEITIQGLQKGQFFINMDSDTDLLMNNMRGPSPRDSPIRDWIVGLVGSLAWPFYRVKFDKMTVRHGKEMLAKGEEGK